MDGNKPVGIAVLVLIYLFVMFFEMALGPIPWLYIAEILTEKGLSLAILWNWIIILIIAVAVPYMIVDIKGAMFIGFGVLCMIVRIIT